ncbi:hypothetical protein WJX81_002962 [Elliptochloris bilobata]|uniref:PHD-type domain-containing protein n=1 Tax=Elliptochloris bilobata TaxID=381761 RepID=A0AAW1SJP7_9CHLO
MKAPYVPGAVRADAPVGFQALGPAARVDDGAERGPRLACHSKAESEALESLRVFLASKGKELPKGFVARVRTRQAGISQGTADVYFYTAEGTRFRSRSQVARFLGVDAPGPAPRQPKVPRALAGLAPANAWTTPGAAVPKMASRESVAQVEQQLMARLREMVEGAGACLEPGWGVEVKQRSTGTRAGSADAYYTSPCGDIFRSRAAVARALGLAVEAGSEGERDPMSPRIDVNMAEEDVAAMLLGMAAPAPKRLRLRSTHTGAEGGGGTAAAGQAAARTTDSAGVSVPIMPAVTWGATAEGKPAAANEEPGVGACAKPLGVRLHISAASGSAAQPGAVLQGRAGRGGGAGEGGEAECQARAGDWRLRLQQAVARAGGVLGGEWSVDAKIRQSGSSKGAADVYFRNSATGRCFRSIAAAEAARPRRAGAEGRMDYLTLNRLADLQYAISSEDTSRGRSGVRKGAAAGEPPGATAGLSGSKPSPAKPKAGVGAGPGRSRLGPRAKGKAAAGEDAEKSPYAKLVNRVRSQLSRIRQEETFLEAYENEGWRGANRERVRPAAELERARLQIEKCKLIMREALKACQEAGGDAVIPAEVYDANGELDEEHIFCAKCRIGQCFEGNDIVLCDGGCSRAYHERCVVPRLHAAELSEEDGWLCPACDAKADILNLINDFFGFEYEQEAPWHAVFAEPPTSPRARPTSASAAPLTFDSLADLMACADLPNSDSADSSFRTSDGDNPCEVEGPAAGARRPASGGKAGSGSGSDANSGSDAGSLEPEELDAALSGDDAPLPQRRKAAAPAAAAAMPAASASPASLPARAGGRGDATAAESNPNPSRSETAAELDEPPAELMAGKRRRGAVDYRALNEQLFGGGMYESYAGEVNDEDFIEPGAKRVRMGSRGAL